LYTKNNPRIYEAAKLYYAEIMMPFRKVIKKNLDKIREFDIQLIAPSHGPLYDHPSTIIKAYHDYVSATPKNEVVITYVSMHGSTKKMVDYLIEFLTEQNINVSTFNLDVTDIGKLAMSLVDAGTIIIGSSMFLGGLHPKAVYAAYLVNTLKPKLNYASYIGSYSWGGRAVDQLKDALKNLNIEILEPVICKGIPKEKDIDSLRTLAQTVKTKHIEKKFL
jgi:flavorubredoxin